MLSWILPFAKKFVTETAQETIAEGAIKSITATARSFFGETAKAAPQFILSQIQNQLDPSKADERAMQEAKAIIRRKDDGANTLRLWDEKMALLSVDTTPQIALLRCNAVRQCLNLQDTPKLVEDIERIAALSPTAFNDEANENGWYCPNPVSVWDAIQRKQNQFNEQFHAHPMRTDVENWSARAAAEARNTKW